MMTAAETYNLAQSGKLWHVAQLPLPLQLAWKSGISSFTAEVVEFQRLAGLYADGKLGPQTLRRLGSVPETRRERLKGIDVSGWQPIGNFSETGLANAGLSFAYIKASQEDKTSNQYAQAQFDLFTKAGLAVGFYHFGDVSEDAHKQADLLCERAAKVAGARRTLPPALDLEWFKDHNHLPDGAFRSWAAKFLNRLADNVDRTAVLYTGPSFWKEHVAGRIEADYLLWTVDYTAPDAEPTLPPGHSVWTFRQYTGSGRSSAYPGRDVDLNHFNGDLTALNRLVQ